LRLVDPDVALPYWAAQANGDIYTEDLVGSVPGTGEGNTVVDGAFANWPVTTDMDWGSDWAGYIQDVEGATNGYVRAREEREARAKREEGGEQEGGEQEGEGIDIRLPWSRSKKKEAPAFARLR
jgi:hypothetical protein